MTETEFNGLIHELGLHQRRKVVSDLLVGNDTQCFSTEQYAEAYHRICHNNNPAHRDGWIKWLVKLTPTHMESIGMIEVRPGIWAEEPKGI